MIMQCIFQELQKDKTIDPDDSDEEVPDDLVAFWNQM